MGVEFSDLKKFKESLRESAGATEDAILNETANVLLSGAIKKTPVRTGNLRRNWSRTPVQTGESGGKSVTVYNPVKYASYVEYGHRKRGGKGWVEGRFMMTDSENELKDGKIEKIAEKHIKRALDGGKR